MTELHTGTARVSPTQLVLDCPVSREYLPGFLALSVVWFSRHQGRRQLFTYERCNLQRKAYAAVLEYGNRIIRLEDLILLARQF